MGNDVSKPTGSGKDDAPAQANAIPLPTPAQTPVKGPGPNRLTPEMTPPRTYGPPTPPSSGISKQPPIPAHARFGFRLGTPTPPETPITPSVSFSLPDTPASLSTSLTTPSSAKHTPKYTTPPSPCSKCHRPILPSDPHTRDPPPRPLRCGHTLCRVCTRTSLLAALATDPFTPAACPCCACWPTSSSSRTSYRPQDGDISLDSPSQSPDIEDDEGGGQKGNQIPLAVLGTASTPAEFLAYRDKLRERKTPVAQRLYCHDKEGCGMFLSGEWQRPRTGTCPLCGGRTCKVCGGRAHLFGAGGGSRLGNKRRAKRTVGLKRSKRPTRDRKGQFCQHQVT
ncbi:hypothetical protein MMYC01_206721 [Madurella mycetomatis]|uniref:RING-type domain-containing protein n=1 Tax=Madurella mycetomatis TaxID=100816 RepID=A0A175W1K3_9PEZI|nr:hypothetical protein MMYC01_206721 [Madurella mycetomatis]